MANKEELAKANKEPMLEFRDKILQNATAADAAVVIVQQKLLKLCESEFIICISLKKQIEEIRKSLDPVSKFLTHHPEAREKTEWKSRLLEAVYRMEDSMDIFQSKLALEDSASSDQTIAICRPNMFRILWAKYSLWKCLKEFNDEIRRLKDVEHIQTDKQQSLGTRALQNNVLGGWDKVLSFDSSGEVRSADMNTLNERMEPGEKDKIAVIVGEQGFGKTFLARKFFTKFHDHFDCCAWVNVSRMFDPDKILRSLLEQVSGDDVQQHDMPPQEMLCSALFQKSYLIVLDDVSEDFSLLSYLIGSLPHSDSGGRLLITTQEQFIAYIIGIECIELQKLNEHESKTLLKGKMNIVGKDLGKPMWEKLKDAFVKKGAGSPLRLSLLGGLIAISPSGKEEKLINEIPDTDDLDHILACCYNRMRSDLKPCLLYMALFPKGYAIPVRRLQRLWLSEGFLVLQQDAKGEPEDLGLEFLKELMIRNFIEVVKQKEDGTPTRVRLVTCLYDSICSGAIGTELLCINSQKETKGGQHQQEQVVSRLRWLTEHSNIKELSLSPVVKINYLRSFLSFNSREGMITQDIGHFLEKVSGKRFNLLTVLDLEGIYKPNLDKVLGKLVLLKHLGLRSTALGSLPKSIANLPYLETLDIKHTNITELHKSFWKKSRNLRHLYLNSYCRIDKSALSSSFATSTETLANLHTLSGAVADIIHVDQSAGIIEGLSNIKKLTKLGIMFQYRVDHQSAIADWISNLKDLQSLKLGIIASSKPSALPPQLSLSQHRSLSKLSLIGKIEELKKFAFPYNLISLTLCGTQMNHNHIVQLENLTNLKFLSLRANSFTEDDLRLPKVLLKRLQVIRLWKLEVLKKIELEDDLPHIKTFELRNCPNMDGVNFIRKLVKSNTIVLLQLIDMNPNFVKEVEKEVGKLKEENYRITFKTTKP